MVSLLTPFSFSAESDVTCSSLIRPFLALVGGFVVREGEFDTHHASSVGKRDTTLGETPLPWGAPYSYAGKTYDILALTLVATSFV